MGIIETIKEYRDTLMERVKSPFIGSFMIVWSIRNWEAFVMLLYNQDNLTIEERINWMRRYFADKHFCELIFWPVFWTIVVLIAYSILNAIGLAIKVAYDDIISPLVQVFVGKKKIILQDDIDKMQRSMNLLKQELANQSKLDSDTRTSYDSLKKESDLYKQQSIQFVSYESLKNALGEGRYLTIVFQYGEVSPVFSRIEIDLETLEVLLPSSPKSLISDVRFYPEIQLFTFYFEFTHADILHKYNVKAIKTIHNVYCGNADSLEIRLIVSDKLMIRIQEALYISKSDSNKFFDVGGHLQRLLDNGEKGVIVTNSNMGGDPDIGTMKRLRIRYFNHDGKSDVKEYKEGEYVNFENW